MSQPVTTNPFTIMLINMTIVFAVLWGLGIIIRLIQYIDPTKKKETAEKPSSALPSAAPVAATVASPQAGDDSEVAAVIAASLAANEDAEIAAVIAAALAAYGCQASRIVSVRPVIGQSWARAARMEVVNTRSQMC